MVDTRVQTDLVHDHDPGLLALVLERLHGRRDVAGGDDVLLVPDGRLDDGSVVDIRDQADDQVTLLQSLVQRLRRGGVDLDGVGTGEGGDHLFGQLDGSAPDGELVALLDDVLDGRGGNEPGTEDEHSLVLVRAVGFLLHTRSDTGKIFLDEVTVLDHGPSEFGEDESRSVDVRVVVLASGDLSEGGGDASLRVEGTADETDLSRGVGGNGGVGVFGDGEETLGGLPQLLDQGQVQPQGLSLGGHVTSLLERLLQQGKVRSFEEGGGRTNGVGRVGDDDVVLVLVLGQELEPVTDKDGNLGVLEDGRHVREVLLRDPDDGLVDITEGNVLDRVVLEDLSDDTTVTSTDDENVLGVRVRSHGQVGNHLLVGELVTLGALDDAVEDEDVAVGRGTEDEDVLVEGLFGVKDLFDLKGHGLACGGKMNNGLAAMALDTRCMGQTAELTWPLRVDLPEPAV